MLQGNESPAGQPAAGTPPPPIHPTTQSELRVIIRVVVGDLLRRTVIVIVVVVVVVIVIVIVIMIMAGMGICRTQARGRGGRRGG